MTDLYALCSASSFEVMTDLPELRARLAQEEEALRRTVEGIAEAESRIEQLQDRKRALEKRVALLRQYIEAVDASDDARGAAESRPVPAEPRPVPATPDPPSSPDPTHVPDSTPSPEPRELRSLIDETRLSEELLPRTHSLEDALLLLLAHHGRALDATRIAREFRRLDHIPDVATPDAIAGELERRPLFFESSPGGGFGLTEEGEDEARRLLARLAV